MPVKCCRQLMFWTINWILIPGSNDSFVKNAWDHPRLELYHSLTFHIFVPPAGTAEYENISPLNSAHFACLAANTNMRIKLVILAFYSRLFKPWKTTWIKVHAHPTLKNCLTHCYSSTVTQSQDTKHLIQDILIIRHSPSSNLTQYFLGFVMDNVLIKNLKNQVFNADFNKFFDFFQDKDKPYFFPLGFCHSFWWFSNCF